MHDEDSPEIPSLELPQTKEPLENLPPEKQQEFVDDMNQSVVAFLEVEARDKATDRGERAQLELQVYEQTLALLKEVSVLQKEGKGAEAEHMTLDFLEKQKALFKSMGGSEENIQKALQEITDFVDYYLQMVGETTPEPTLKMKLLSAGINLLPFVGGPKMLSEATLGKTLAGEDLSGVSRLIHGAEGVVWTGLDVVSLGSMALATDTGKTIVEGADWIVKAAEKGQELKDFSHGLIDIAPSQGIVDLAQSIQNAPSMAESILQIRDLMRIGKGAAWSLQGLYEVGKWMVGKKEVGEKANRLLARGLETRDLNNEQNKPDDFVERAAHERAELLAAVGDVLNTSKKAA